MKYKILIADDSLLNLNIVKIILNDAGYETFEAHNGSQAVEIALAKLPDLILLDWQMPIMNGIEALTILKKEKSTCNIPIIIVTGIATTAENLTEAFNKGAIDFIKKPFEKTELLARVNAMITLVKYYQNWINTQIKENEASLIQLSRMSKLQNEIARKLNDLKATHPNFSSFLEDMIQNISDELSTEAWKRYEESFEQLNPSFLKNILTKHPSLTPAEIRLCTLLRLNLSSKEIASRLCQEENSIRVSRSRLRKKLGIPEEDNLVAYLLKF